MTKLSQFAGAATGAPSPPSTVSVLTSESSPLSGESTRVKSGLEAGSRAGADANAFDGLMEVLGILHTGLLGSLALVVADV